MPRLVLSGLLIAICAAPAQSAGRRFVSGEQIIEYCTAPKGDVQRTDCLGYVTGIADALSRGPVGNISACVPPHVTRHQMRDAVVKWLAANPQLRHFAASSLVATALAKSYPCRR